MLFKISFQYLVTFLLFLLLLLLLFYFIFKLFVLFNVFNDYIYLFYFSHLFLYLSHFCFINLYLLFIIYYLNFIYLFIFIFLNCFGSKFFMHIPCNMHMLNNFLHNTSYNSYLETLTLPTWSNDLLLCATRYFVEMFLATKMCCS